MKNEFQCRECGKFMALKYKGKAIDEKDNPIDVCVWCCLDEQKKRFMAEM